LHGFHDPPDEITGSKGFIQRDVISDPVEILESRLRLEDD
jgi:hypothetical protein